MVLEQAFVGSAGAVRVAPAFQKVGAQNVMSKKTTGAVVPLASRSRATLNMAITRPERYATTDWVKALITLPRSQVLKRISSHVVANSVVASAVVLAYESNPDLVLWKLSPLPWTVLGTVMGLLLVFRTNSAYDRFWEGRKVWGALVNRTRSLGINFMNWVGPNSDSPVPQLSIKLVKLDQAFPRSLANHLRGQQEPDEILKEYIPAEHWDDYYNARNRPLYVIRLISMYVAQAYSMRDLRDGNTNAERETIERGLNDFADIMGMCERIVKTPVPLSYSRHTSRFLSLWCLTLPVIFVKADEWLVPLIMAFVSFALFSIEEIGHCIEDPFIKNGFDLPLETISETIAGDLQNMLDSYPTWTDSVQPVVKGSAGRKLASTGSTTGFE